MGYTKDRWEGIKRPYSKEDVQEIRGSLHIEYTLARRGAEKLWHLLHSEPYVPALGAMSPNQAKEMVRAGLKAIYVSGWQVAAGANAAGEMYPDQSLYPANSVPTLVRDINQCLQRADQIEYAEKQSTVEDWFVPLVADAEAGFGGRLNAFELMKAMIKAGAAAVHYEDQLSSEKKCGHMGGKVLIPTSWHIRTLLAARLAADVCDVPAILIARTDAESAKLITDNVDKYNYERRKTADKYDADFITEERTLEGFYRLKEGTELERCITRGLAYAPYADMLWMETSTPDLGQAKAFAEGIHKEFPGKLLAYNCSPSFHWRKHLDDSTIKGFQKELGAMGYKFQFVTLAGFHSLNHGMFELARGYRDHGMGAYAQLQDAEFAAEKFGYTTTRHQREVGTGYFDLVSKIISSGTTSTIALDESTEKKQFGKE